MTNGEVSIYRWKKKEELRKKGRCKGVVISTKHPGKRCIYNMDYIAVWRGTIEDKNIS